MGMSTPKGRASRVTSYFCTYLLLTLALVYVSPLFLSRYTPKASPQISLLEDRRIEFTPNVDLTRTDVFNVKEIYVSLVHQTERNGKVHESTVWDKLVKKSKRLHLNERERGGIEIWRGLGLRKGKLVLKGSYFHHIGPVVEKVFAEFTPKISGR